MQPMNTSLADGFNAIRPGHAEIARCAAQLWEKRGRPQNCDEEIWLEAEQLLMIDLGHRQPKPTRLAQPKPAAKGGFTSQPRLKSAGISSRTLTNPVPPVA